MPDYVRKSRPPDKYDIMMMENMYKPPPSKSHKEYKRLAEETSYNRKHPFSQNLDVKYPGPYGGGKKSKKAKPKKKSRTRKAKPSQTKMPQKRIKSLIKKEKKQQNDIYLNSKPSLLKIKERNLKNATFKKNTKWEKYPSYTSLMTQVQ